MSEIIEAPDYLACWIEYGDADGLSPADIAAAKDYFDGYRVNIANSEATRFVRNLSLYGGAYAVGGNVIEYVITPI